MSVLVFLCVNRLVGQAFQYGEAWFGLCDGDEVGERLVVDDSRILRTHPLLVNFSMIDEETLRAALGILVIAEQTSLALAMSQHLQVRGLIPQGGLVLYVRSAKEQGLSDNEIISTLLFEGVLSLKKQVDQFKKEVDQLKSDLEKKKQLLDIVPEIVNVASKT